MSGVRVGSRLDQLLELRRQVELEIEQERRLHPELAPPSKPAKAKKPARSGYTRPDAGPRMAARMARLAELGVTQRDVKVWAVEQGLLAEVRRGSVREDLIDAYAEAHPSSHETVEW